MKAMTVRLPQIRWTEHGVKSEPIALDILPGTVAVSVWIWGQTDLALRITDREDEVVLEVNESAFTHGPIELYHPVADVLFVERRIASEKWSMSELSRELVVYCRNADDRWASGPKISVVSDDRPLDPPLGWKIVEVFGRVSYAGYVEHIRVAGTNMLRVRCPQPDGGEVVRIFSPKAVFSFHDTTEEAIRKGEAEIPPSTSSWDWQYGVPEDAVDDDEEDGQIQSDYGNDPPILGEDIKDECTERSVGHGLVVRFYRGIPMTIYAPEDLDPDERERVVLELLKLNGWQLQPRSWRPSERKSGMVAASLDDDENESAPALAIDPSLTWTEVAFEGGVVFRLFGKTPVQVYAPAEMSADERRRRIREACDANSWDLEDREWICSSRKPGMLVSELNETIPF